MRSSFFSAAIVLMFCSLNMHAQTTVQLIAWRTIITPSLTFVIPQAGFREQRDKFMDANVAQYFVNQQIDSTVYYQSSGLAVHCTVLIAWGKIHPNADSLLQIAALKTVPKYPRDHFDQLDSMSEFDGVIRTRQVAYVTNQKAGRREELAYLSGVKIFPEGVVFYFMSDRDRARHEALNHFLSELTFKNTTFSVAR